MPPAWAIPPERSTIMKRTDRSGKRTVSISAESRRLLKRHALYGLWDDLPRADGRYEVQLDDEVLECLHQIDTDIDKAIEHLCQVKH
jgi:hypothetical protein